MIFTKSSDIPAGVNDVLDEIANFSAGMTVSELINTISERLRKYLAAETKAHPLSAGDSDVEMVDQVAEEDDGSEDEYDVGFSDDEDDGFGPFSNSQGKKVSKSYKLTPEVRQMFFHKLNPVFWDVSYQSALVLLSHVV
jgi:hypothetical protein